MFSKPFFDLQFTFAERVSTLSGIPLPSALLDYTNLYVRLGLGRNFDSKHNGWQTYLAGLVDNTDVRAWTYQCYVRNAEVNTSPVVEAAFGCFSYAILSTGEAKLHFRNSAMNVSSPLSRASYDQRRAELSLLFAHLKATRGSDVVVAGSSWLYNLNAYTRLFPREYVANVQVVHGRYQSMARWGQFVDYRGQLIADVAVAFLKSLQRAQSFEELDACFAFQTLAVSAPAQTFYDFLGI